MKWLVVLCLGLASTCHAASPEIGFLWPGLWKGGSGQLVDVEASLTENDPVTRAIVELAIRDALLREGRVHAADEYQQRLQARCDTWEETDYRGVAEEAKARAAFVCASDYGSRVGFADPFSRLKLSGRLRGALQQSQLEKISPLERYAAEARLYAFLPPGQGQDFGRSLLALNILERSQPTLDGTRDLFARVYQVQRNGAALETRALSRRPDRTVVDGIAYGISPYLFGSPLRGVGLGVVWNDERLGDTDRQIELNGWGASRGAFGGAFTYSDAESTLLRLETKVEATSGEEDFFGVGVDAASRSVFSATRVGGRFGARLGHPVGLQFAGGFSGTTVAVRNDPSGQLASVYHVGPYLEMALDTRDSRFTPQRGALYRLQGYAPLARDFAVASFTAQQFLELGWRSALSFSAQFQATLGAPPVLAFPRLVASGLREGRYLDRQTVVAGLEYRRLVSGPISAVVFGNFLSMASDIDKFSRARWIPGFGGAVEYAFSAYSRPRARLEVGVYGGETAFAFNAGAAF